MKTRYEPLPVQLIKQINLPKGMIPINVHMYDEPKVLSGKDLNLFLYTSGLATCVAAMVYCPLDPQNKIIGLAHLYADVRNDKITDELSRKNGKIKDAKPKKLDTLINLVKSNTLYSNQPIYIYFAGGRGDQWSMAYYNLYIEYAKGIDNVVIAGLLLDPFQLTDEVRFNFDFSRLNLYTTAGITSEGVPLAHKNININLSSIYGQFHNTKDLDKYILVNHLKAEEELFTYNDQEGEDYGITYSIDSQINGELINKIMQILQEELLIHDLGVCKQLLCMDQPYSSLYLQEIYSLVKIKLVQDLLIEKKDYLLQNIVNEIGIIFDIPLVLKNIEPHNRFDLIKQFELNKHIHSLNKFIAIASTLTPVEQLDLIKLLWYESLILFTKTDNGIYILCTMGRLDKKTISEILLLPENKKRLADLKYPSFDLIIKNIVSENLLELISEIWGNKILSLIEDSYRLASTLKVLPDAIKLKFMEELLGSKYIQSLINKLPFFFEVVKNLPMQLIIPFVVNVLGKSNMQSLVANASDVYRLARELPQNILFEFIENILGEKKIFTLLNTTNNSYEICTIVNCIPEEWQLKIDPSEIQKKCQHWSNLQDIVKSVSKNCRLKLLLKLDSIWLNEFLTDFQIEYIAKLLTNEEKNIFFEHVKNKISVTEIEANQAIRGCKPEPQKCLRQVNQ